MSYISERKIRLQTQLTTVQAQITALNTALTEMSTSGVQSYSFSSGEGEQRTTRRSLKEITESLSQLLATEAHLINELYGMGIVAVKLRRKQ
jgi:hypothetical protein